MYQIQFLMNSVYYTIPHFYETLTEAEADMNYIKPEYPTKRIINFQ